MIDFYRQLAARDVLHHDDDHVVLPREDSYLKVCLPVHDLAESRQRAQALGGHLASPDREWEARGFRACDGHDPEGNVIQLRVIAR